MVLLNDRAEVEFHVRIVLDVLEIIADTIYLMKLYHQIALQLYLHLFSSPAIYNIRFFWEGSLNITLANIITY